MLQFEDHNIGCFVMIKIDSYIHVLGWVEPCNIMFVSFLLIFTVSIASRVKFQLVLESTSI